MFQIDNVFSSHKTLIYVLFFSFLLKILLLIFIGPQPISDGYGYMKIAENIYVNDFAYPISALDDAPGSVYLYALFHPLGELIGMSAYALPNILLATAMVGVVYKTVRLIHEEIRVANLAAIIVAFYPFFNFYAITILTETLFLFLIYTSFFYAVRYIKYWQFKDILLFSILFALASLTRFAAFSMFPFFILLFIIAGLYVRKRLYIFRPLLAVSCFMLVMLPWALKNYHYYGKFSFTTPDDKLGLALWVGNNPMNKSGGGIGYVDFNWSDYDHIKDPNERAEIAGRDAMAWIKDNPHDWLVLEYRKLKRFFSPVFYAEQYQALHYQLMSIMSYGVIAILFLYGIVMRLKSLFLLYSPMILFALMLTAIHLITFASIRYRLPIEPFMIMVASAVLYHMLYIMMKKRSE